MGASYTSDLTPDGIRQMVRSAIDLAALTSEDPHAALPDPDELGSLQTDLTALFSDETAELATERRIEIARRAEAAALLARRPAHHQLRRARPSTRAVSGRALRQPRAASPRLLSVQLLLDYSRSRSNPKRQHGARLLVHDSAQLPRARRCGNGRTQSRRTRRSGVSAL